MSSTKTSLWASRQLYVQSTSRPRYCNLKQKQTRNDLLQESSKDTLRILPDPNDEIVEEAAAKMGLRKVGWIFTDLVASATTHFWSACCLRTFGREAGRHHDASCLGSGSAGH